MEDARIALYFDYENLAIGAREDLGTVFDFRPIADALAERGRVVVRKAYADWTYFNDDRQMLVENHVEMIEIPQRKGAVRKTAADITMAVDAIELAFERDYVTTFVLCTGDSDFSPLVHKLRELNKKVIGVGLKASTSRLLPPACDEFLFYENLDGVDLPLTDTPQAKVIRRGKAEPAAPAKNLESLDGLISRTLGGLQRSTDDEVRISQLKRALLRTDSTFSESDYGFRSFSELMRNLAEREKLQLDASSRKGDPVVSFPEDGRGEGEAFELLVATIAAIKSDDPVALSSLKDEMRKADSDFSEKRYGYGGFLQFVKAASAKGVVEMDFDAESGAYSVSIAG